MKNELTKKSKEDLKKELTEKHLRLREIRFGIAGSKSKNVKEYGNIKKEIARMETALKVVSTK